MTGSELVALRARFGWSQARAAQVLGCSARSISNWESGRHEVPDSIALAASAVAMGLPPYGAKRPR